MPDSVSRGDLRTCCVRVGTDDAADYKVCVQDVILTSSVARAHENTDFTRSKFGPEVIKAAVPLIRNPVPGPILPATLLLPNVINIWLLVAMLASVRCM